MIQMSKSEILRYKLQKILKLRLPRTRIKLFLVHVQSVFFYGREIRTLTINRIVFIKLLVTLEIAKVYNKCLYRYLLKVRKSENIVYQDIDILSLECHTQIWSCGIHSMKVQRHGGNHVICINNLKQDTDLEGSNDI